MNMKLQLLSNALKKKFRQDFKKQNIIYAVVLYGSTTHRLKIEMCFHSEYIAKSLLHSHLYWHPFLCSTQKGQFQNEKRE